MGIWHNPYVTKPGGNYTRAWQILQDAGFYISDGILYQPNGVPVRDEIHALSPSEAPTSVAFTQEFVDKWNDFFDNYLGVTNCNFFNDPIPFNTLIIDAFYYRNFDLYFGCWHLDRFPDFIYDFFHSSLDMPWGYNSPGIKDDALDALLETVKWGLDFEEKLEACLDAQALLAEELVPYIYVYHRIYWCIWRAHTPDAIVNVINMQGVGADNRWTWNLAHWASSPTGGTVKYNLGVEPDYLHPGWADSAYEIWILDRCMDTLTAVNPQLMDIPWIAVHWEMETFSWPPLGIYNGTKVIFRIRSDVQWHDGWPVTSEDINFSFEFMKNFPRFKGIWKYYAWSDVLDPFTVVAYFNITSQWIVYELSEMALLFPKHIYNPDWHPTRDTINDPVWEISWQDWMSDYTGPIPEEVGDWSPGDPPPSGLMDLKALVGCGPYYFTVWDPEAVTAVLRKNPNYWVNVPCKQNIFVQQITHPATPFEFYVELVNVGSKTDGELGPITIDYVDVYADEEYLLTISGPITIDPFDYVVFGPYTFSFENPGQHYLSCYAYEDGTLLDVYTFPLKVTSQCDVNGDFKFDIRDVILVARAYGSYPGHPNWDPRADVNWDYVVDEADLTFIYICAGGRPPDIAVVNLNVSRPIFHIDYGVMVSVTVSNDGPPITADLSISFNSSLVSEVEEISLLENETKTVTFAIIPRSFLFQEISRLPTDPCPVYEGPQLNCTGDNTSLICQNEDIEGAPLIVVPAGKIYLKDLNGNLIMSRKVVCPQDPNVFTAVDYDNGLYVVGTRNGSLYFITENGECGELKLGDSPVSNVTVEGFQIKVVIGNEEIILERKTLDFSLPPGNYTIGAHAWPLMLMDENTTNNVFTDGTVWVRWPYDITGDGYCGIDDIVMV
ncbi:hypothetical protein DRO69_13785, partial [Candidatus Bathyarchaeota archaeon]